MDKIETCISFLTGKSAQTMSRLSRECLTPHGITPVQYAVLQVLWEHDGISAKAISERLIIDSATITGIIDRLERDQLLSRSPSPDDRRVNLVFLTKKGASLKSKLQASMNQLNRRVAEAIGDDADTLWHLLEKLAQLELEADNV